MLIILTSKVIVRISRAAVNPDGIVEHQLGEIHSTPEQEVAREKLPIKISSIRRNTLKIKSNQRSK